MKLSKISITFWIFLLALILRLGYLFFLRQNYFFFDHPAADAAYYLEWARRIADGDWLGSKTFYGLPLYPYFLAVLDRLMLGHTMGVRVLQIFLGSFNCVLAVWIGRKVFSEKIARLAGILTAANFILIYYDGLLMPVTLLIFVSQVIILAFLHQDQLRGREWFILGLICGLGILGDGKILIFLGMTFLISRDSPYLSGKVGTVPTFPIFMLILGVTLVLGLTGLRNKIVGGSWVWVSAQSGLSFYAGNNPKADGTYQNPDFIRPTHQGQDEDQKIMAESLSGRRLSDAEVSRFWLGQGLKFIREQPLEYFKLLGQKFALFFTETERAFDLDLILQRQWKRRLDWNPYVLILPLALLGMRKIGTVPTYLLSQLIFTLIFFLTNRHRATILPFLIIYESAAVFWILEKIRHKKFLPLGAAVVFLLAFWAIFPPQSLPAKEVEFLKFSKAGPVYEQKGDFARAEAAYHKALAIHPEDTNSLYNLGNTYALQDKFAQAKEAYQKVLALNPMQIDALFNLAFCHEQTGDIAQARELYRQVLELNPQSADAYFQLGKTFEAEGDCDKAREYYQSVILLNPEFAQILSQQTTCFH